MTRDQFNHAIETLQQGDHDDYNDSRWSDAEREGICRVACASAYVMKHRRGIPDDAEWTCPAGAIPEFLAGLSADQRRKLKQIADSIDYAGRGNLNPLTSVWTT